MPEMLTEAGPWTQSCLHYFIIMPEEATGKAQAEQAQPGFVCSEAATERMAPAAAACLSVVCMIQ